MASGYVAEEMYEPSLQRIQAFFLLSIAQWGNGDKHRSIIHMGIAVKMAAILGLHREETYRLPEHAGRDEVVDAEAARRTFWMIQSQDNLHSGHKTPVSFSHADITVLLPCDESEFAFGRVPRFRAALHDTLPALREPDRVSPPDRSLFATLIQAHNLWGIVARRACKTEDDLAGVTTAPAEPASEYRLLADRLRHWEETLSSHHRWSVWNLRGYKTESLELAYLAIVMVVRLSNIVLRRTYMEDLIAASHSSFDANTVANAEFWQTMAHELFANVLELHEQIDAYFPLRLKEDGFPAVLAFCVYICGSAAAHLWRWPNLCPHAASEAETMATQSLAILSELQYAWPTASRWQQGLRSVTTPASESGPSPAAVANAFRVSRSYPPTYDSDRAARHVDHQHSVQPLGGHGLLEANGVAESSDQERVLPQAADAYDPTAISSHLGEDSIGAFEAELAALLQGDLNAGFYDGWELPASF
ncbi:hypothetical protein LTR85_000007 [Meristemomyces frigidus]|nr:hypothetical protein LTR85_000007 [Meristemomyces frigidus]